MGRSCRTLFFVPLAALALAALPGCVDEKIVYRDRDLFEDPLSNAGNFLGYTDATTQLTVCGNCHVEKQADWEATGHAAAWADMKANPSATSACESCHSTNELGNVVTVTAGHNATGEARYEAVQCESCHGPGLTHVTDPKDATIPLAPIDVGADLSKSCGECHAGAHHPFAEEWNLSRHGEGARRPQYRNREECKDCHGGEGALEAWGVRTEFLEQGEDQPIAITCAVCHDPHSDELPGQLRYSVGTANVNANLCMKCHQRRAIPDLSETPGGSSGPHSPQGPLLLGEVGTVGWTPSDLGRLYIRGTHGSPTGNPRLCATCHVNSYEVTDPATGAHVFTATGHLFKPIPCVDAQGIPNTDDSCALDEASRSWASCTNAGCHGDATAAITAYDAATGRIDDLVAELDALVDQVELNDPTQINRNDTIFTVAEGARFNQALGEIRSSAIHNPFLMEALLDASITAVMDEYGLPAQTGVQLGTIWPQIAEIN